MKWLRNQIIQGNKNWLTNDETPTKLKIFFSKWQLSGDKNWLMEQFITFCSFRNDRQSMTLIKLAMVPADQ